jgi:8-oxo-dGTP pyrophosphatase MutT (NUDIX family)
MESVAMAAGVLLWSGSAESPRFLALRNARHGGWGFAKGHLEPGEDLIAGALRECREETGLRLAAADLLPGFADASHYLTPQGRRKRVVMFLAARPCATSAPARSREHDTSEWWTPAEAIERLPFEELRRCVVRATERLRAGVPQSRASA